MKTLQIITEVTGLNECSFAIFSPVYQPFSEDKILSNAKSKMH